MSHKILVMAAVEAEREAILRGVQADGRFDVRLAGVGPIAAAARTAKELATGDYAMVISAGIGGGFPGQAAVGSIVAATSIVGADLGAETQEGFDSLDRLGFGFTRIETGAGMAERFAAACRGRGIDACAGPILTVSTATGTAVTAARLADRVPGAAAEAMEGFGAATAAREFGLPAFEIRAVSNAVGPRNRAAWKIKEALVALEAACALLPEVLEL